MRPYSRWNTHARSDDTDGDRRRASPTVSVSTRQRPGDPQIARIDPGHQHDAIIMMAEADVEERHPGERRRHHQKRHGDQLGRARADGRGLGRMVVAMREQCGTSWVTWITADDRSRPAQVNSLNIAVIMRLIVVTVIQRVAAGMTRMRAIERDRASEQRAEQWRRKQQGVPWSIESFNPSSDRNIVNRDRPAVAEIDDEHGEADRSFGGRDGQHEAARTPARQCRS